MTGWIAVDLDGTLAHYDGWRGVDHIGEPIVPMVRRVKRWLRAGREVRIFTARVDQPTRRESNRAIGAVHAWCRAHLGITLAVTNVKDRHLDELWDDRAVQVAKNKGTPVGRSTRGLR